MPRFFEKHKHPSNGRNISNSTSSRRRTKRYGQKSTNMERNVQEVENQPGRNELSGDVETPNADKIDCSLPVLPTNDAIAEARKRACDEKFRQGLKYQDKESYANQRDHNIGIGLYNTDELEDLPPRHKKNVIKAYEELKALKMELIKQYEAACSGVTSPASFPNHKTQNFCKNLDEKGYNCSQSLNHKTLKHEQNSGNLKACSSQYKTVNDRVKEEKPLQAEFNGKNFRRSNKNEFSKINSEQQLTSNHDFHKRRKSSSQSFSYNRSLNNSKTIHKDDDKRKHENSDSNGRPFSKDKYQQKHSTSTPAFEENYTHSQSENQRISSHIQDSNILKSDSSLRMREKQFDSVCSGVPCPPGFVNHKMQNFSENLDTKQQKEYICSQSQNHKPLKHKQSSSNLKPGSSPYKTANDKVKEEKPLQTEFDRKHFRYSSKNEYSKVNSEQQSTSNHNFNKKGSSSSQSFSYNRSSNNSKPKFLKEICEDDDKRNLENLESNDRPSSKDKYQQKQSTPTHAFEESYIRSLSENQRIGSQIKDSMKLDNPHMRETNRVKAEEEKRIDVSRIPSVRDNGFFLHITVSEDSNKLDMWKLKLKKSLKIQNFDVEKCCDYAESLIVCFKSKNDAILARSRLLKMKHKTKDLSKLHIKSLSGVKYHVVRPCMCEEQFMQQCDKYFDEFAFKYIASHRAKTDVIIDELNSLKMSKSKSHKEQCLNLKDALDTLKAMETVFSMYVKKAKELARSCSMGDLKKLKLNFSRECNSFERCLPIYSQKDVILNVVMSYPVCVIVAETGSGKSTQLTQYLMQTSFADKGSIICTQPRKIAAVSITKFVSMQIGSSVGSLEVGYDVGIETKYDSLTKIIYMTDYALLRKCLRNKTLKGISCVIIDEAHERTLYTDLLLGLLKQCLESRSDLRIIITSATINPSVFVNYFNLPDGAVINIPGRAYPVEVIWSGHDVDEGYMYVNECVKTAVRVHQREPKGDILVFLSSPAEIDEAILLFEEMCPKGNMPELMSLHGKSDLKDQMLIFEASTSGRRRVIFATNAAETSLTIPGIKYVIDSGMAKEMIFYPEKNKSCLMPTLINKSSAEQRKGRAGRTQPGVCYRLYSKKDYESMPQRALPELLKTDLLNALLKVYEFGITPRNFDFVESPSKEAISRSIESLEVLELIENNALTKLGQQVVQLSIEPRLAKFILLGVECGMGHEAAIIAALVSEAGRIFLRFDDNKEAADKKKKMFCQRNGDLCTFLEIYKRWLEVSQEERFNWCVSNCVSSKALNSARKTVHEALITLRQELGIKVSRKYNNLSFKKNFETILFRCFVENLCIYSGHPSLGYQSPNFRESLFIHPSSSLKYLRIEPPKFLVYTVFMETSRNYILDVTPLKEETVNKAFFQGNYALSVDNLKQLQIPPITLGPFGEKVLSRYILGKGGAVISNIEYLLERLTRNKNFRIDICRDKGLVIVHVEEKFHDKVRKFIHDIVNDARGEMAKEADVIQMDEGLSYYCLTTGGIVLDIIMPGEFREITIEPIEKGMISEYEPFLKKCGSMQAFEINNWKSNKHSLNIIYHTVASAQKALKCLNERKVRGVRVRNIVPETTKSSKPLYKLKFTWPRLFSKGTGSILFASEEDQVMVSGMLSTKSLYVDDNRINLSPSTDSKSLLLKNLPQSASEKILQEKISDVLPDFLKKLVKGVKINRLDKLPVVESDIMKLKDELLQKLCRFTPPSKIIVNIVHPTAVSKNYEAFAHFECAEDGKKAFEQLNDNLKLNNIPVNILETLQAEVKCQEHVYNYLKKDIHHIIEQQGGRAQVQKLSKSYKNEVVIKFYCSTIEKLYILIKDLSRLVRGHKVECRSNKKYFYLFTETGKQILDEVQMRTKTLIKCDTDKKIVFIYNGDREKCYRAEFEIHSYIKEAKLLKKKIFDLKNSNIPPGFLKELYSRYGWDLYGLIRRFDLKAANIDMKFGNLTIEGDVHKIKKIEEHLEEICCKLYENKAKKDDDFGFGACAICLDPVKFDYYRLENCGHSFCKSCLLLQLESKIIPVACAQENCGKPFFLIDINRILSLGGEKHRKEFLNAALQYHVRTHPGEVGYCPTPDCHTVYRVSRKQDVDFHCPSCSNDICTHCQTFAHKGMSCDIFQNSKTDEDYSLKVWMKKNEASCKQCPKCKVAIEKIEGCNHMQCANCETHLCWLCLEIFSSGDEVYDHMPYCPKNQRSS